MTVCQPFDSTSTQQCADDWSQLGPQLSGVAARALPRGGWRQHTFARASREPSQMAEHKEKEESCSVVVEIPEVCTELCTVKEEEESEISDHTPVPEPEAEFEMLHSSREQRSNDEVDNDDDGGAPLDETLLRLQQKVARMLDAYGAGSGQAKGGAACGGEAQEHFNDDIEYLELQRKLLQRRLRASEQRRRILEQDNKELQQQLQNALRGGGGSSPSTCRSDKRREDNQRPNSSPRPRQTAASPGTSPRARSTRKVGSPSPPRKRPERNVVPQELAKVSQSMSRSALTSSGSLRPVLEKSSSLEHLRLERRDGSCRLKAPHSPSKVEQCVRDEIHSPALRPHERVQAGNSRSAHCPPRQIGALPTDHLEIGGFSVESEPLEVITLEAQSSNADRDEAVVSSAPVPLLQTRVGPGRGLVWPALPKQVASASVGDKQRQNPGRSRELTGSRPRQRTGDVLSAARRHSKDAGRRAPSSSHSPRQSAASSKLSARLGSNRTISPERRHQPPPCIPRPPPQPAHSRESRPIGQISSCAFNPDSYMSSRMLP